MIPSGWTEIHVGDLIELESGVSVNGEDRPIEDSEVGVLKVSAVTYGRFDPSAHKAILPSELHRASTNPRADNIIISRANTTDLVGASAYIFHDYPDLFLSDKLWQTKNVPENLSIRWLSYVLSSERVRYSISNRATGTSGSMKNISQQSFLSIKVPVPPLPEQHKIAAILSTWDEAITLTERLIAALQERKRGLMQRLLTGEVRFPGFEGEWRETALAHVVIPVTRKEDVDPEREYRLIGVRWYVAGAHIHEVVPGDEIATSNLSLIKEGDILYNKMWVTKSAFGIARHEHDGAYGTSEYPQFQAREGMLNVDFMGYLFNNSHFQYEATRLCKGTTGRARLNPGDFLKIEIHLPPYKEQVKIADVLSDCDRESELLSSRLELLKTQKRGLMQRLLTGQVRVQEIG